MKRIGALALLVAAAAGGPALRAQEGRQPPKNEETALERAADSPAEGEHGKLEMWKWANFAVLAAGLGYLVAKNAGPFFSARSQQIRKDMVEAQEARQQAEARAADVDRRLANLESDIAALRAESQQEARSETELLARHTAAEIAKIQAHAEQEIVSAGKAARQELKRFSAGLAVRLAEQRIRSRMTPETQEALVRGFVRDLDPPASSATN
jgi:F-type H+-transporting ATPase subunit b